MCRWLWLLLLLALVATVASGQRLTTFAWDQDPSWPLGTTIELCGNGPTCLTGITGLSATLSLPVNPGEVIQGMARAIPPPGYQCGEPLADCLPSEWATVQATWPANLINGWARYQREEVTPVAASFVQQKASSIEMGSATTVASGNLPSSVTAGNALIAFIFYQRPGLSETSVSLTDTAGSNDSWIEVDTSFWSNVYYFGARVFYLPNTASGTANIQATFGGASINRTILVYEFSGLATSDVLLASLFNQQDAPGTGSNAITSGLLGVLSTQPAMIFGISINVSPGNAPTAGTGFTSLDSQVTYDRAEYRAVTATDSVAATFTAASGQDGATYLAFGAAFKEAVVGLSSLPIFMHHYANH